MAGLGVGALVLLALALRTRGIGRMGLWYDEVELWLYSLTGHTATPSEPPLPAWILSGVMEWFQSADPLFLHVVPAVLGSLGVLVAWRLAVRVSASPGAGLCAAALVAISPMAVYYSREGRPYGLFMLVSTALLLVFVRAHETNRPASWLLYSCVLTLCFLSHALTYQIAIALGAFGIAARLLPGLTGSPLELRVRRLLYFLLFSVLAVPGLIWLVRRDSPVAARWLIEGLYPYGLHTFLRNVLVHFGPGPFGQQTGFAFGVSEGVALLFFAGFVLGLRELHRRRRDDLVLLFLLWIGVPLLFNYATLGPKSNWPWMRWISHALTPYLVVVAVGLDGLGRGLRWRPAAALAVAILAVGTLPHAIAVPESPEYAQQRAVAGYLEEHSDALEGVIVLPFLHNLGPADPRITNIYFQLKRETLPTWHLEDGRLRRLERVPLRGGFVRLPRQADGAGTPPASGRWAVLSRQPLVHCGDIPRALKQPHAQAGETTRVVQGLTLCELVFAEPAPARATSAPQP